MADPMRIRAQAAGDKATVRVLMSHEMESGQRKDAAGKVEDFVGGFRHGLLLRHAGLRQSPCELRRSPWRVWPARAVSSLSRFIL